VFTNAAAYLATLPEVETYRLPKGTLFAANNLIYQVIETGSFAKARQWRRDESTDVALVPNSFPARYLPLIRTGRLLPVYRSRTELTENGGTRCFVFPTENLALDSAYFDVALIMSAGAYVRNHNHEPAFAATDGVHVFRLYYYLRSSYGKPTIIKSNQIDYPRCDLRPHTEGPGYWRLLSGWQETLPSSQVTQQMSAVKLPPEPPPLPAQPAKATQLSMRPVIEPPPPEDDDDLGKTRPHYVPNL